MLTDLEKAFLNINISLEWPVEWRPQNSYAAIYKSRIWFYIDNNITLHMLEI